VSGGSKDVTIGYKYELGIHMALCHGPIDSITRIEVDRRIAWEGLNTGGVINVSAPNLFGGNQREGGVSGRVSIEMGADDQAPNSYLESILGADVPAFRGVTCAVLEQVYTGNNPYLKPWSFRAQRIHTTSNGDLQWYDGKSEITKLSECEPYTCDSLSSTILALGGFPLDDPNRMANIPESAYTEQSVYSLILGGNTTPLAGSSFSPNYVWTPTADFCEDEGLRWKFEGGTEIANFVWFDIGGIATFSAAQTTYTHIVREQSSFAALDYVFSIFVSTANNNPVTSYDVNPRIAVSITSTHATFTSSFAGTNPSVSVPLEDLPGDIHTITVSPTLIGFYDGVEVNSITNVWQFKYRLVWTCWVDDADPVTIQEETTASTDIDVLPVPYFGNNLGRIRIYRSGTTFTAGFLVGADHYTVHEGLKRNYSSYQPASSCGNCNDMNPAHIIRECLTDGAWGMGYNSSDIDDDAFMSAANTLYSERMGISLVWSQEMPLEDFIAEILRHIDGVLYVSRVTGKFVLKLIRNDYVFSSLVQLNESNVSVVSDARRPAVGELVASLTVNYWDSETGETGSVTEHNQALFQIQTGGGGSTTVQYPGFTHFEIASRAARRDLTTLSTPLLSCVIEVNRDAELLNIGDAFRLDWPDLNISNQVMRVQQMSLGDGRNNTVKIEAVEDVFSLPESGGSATQPGLWVDPTTALPLPASPRIVTELPYYQLTQAEGESSANQILSDEPDAGFLLYAGGRQQNELNARVDVDSGAGYAEVRTPLDFAPYAYLLSDVGHTDSQIFFTGEKDIDLVTVGTVAQIGQELVSVDGVESNYITVGRGVLDTVPARHNIDFNNDVAIVFWGSSAESDEVQYVLSDAVNVRMRTVLGANVLPSGQSPVDSYTFSSRASRPYPPGNLRVDGVSYPDPDDSSAVFYTGAHSITWAHRDRLQQTGGEIFDYLTGDIGPEAGTTYLVEAYSTLVGGTVTEPWLSVNVGSDTFYEQDSNTDSNIGEPPTNSDRVHFRVTSLRDGYQSWQSPEVTLVYEQIDSSAFDSNGSPTDPNFADVSLLLHMDGADASTTFTDSSSDARTVTNGGSDTKISTAQSKFGGASGYWDGTGDFLAPSADAGILDLTTDFTVEYWVYQSSAGATLRTHVHYNIVSGNGGLHIYRNASTGYLQVDNGATETTAGTIVIPLNEWVHIAVVRTGSTIKGFVNGAECLSNSVQTYVAATTVLIGNFRGGLYPYLGYMDELRITKGVARYTSAFTPPTAPFPDA